MSIPWRKAPCNIKQSNFAPLAPRSLYNAVFTNGAVADEEGRVYIYYAACYPQLCAGTGAARGFR